MLEYILECSLIIICLPTLWLSWNMCFGYLPSSLWYLQLISRYPKYTYCFLVKPTGWINVNNWIFWYTEPITYREFIWRAANSQWIELSSNRVFRSLIKNQDWYDPDMRYHFHPYRLPTWQQLSDEFVFYWQWDIYEWLWLAFHICLGRYYLTLGQVLSFI